MGNRERYSAEDRHDIERQVEKILAHPLFHQSKRLPVFLRYVINESLNGNEETGTKERVIGVEAFGRKPDYDNNSDPIVRVTATELRKKLAQYYYEDGRADEIRIEVPTGTYLPRFHRPHTDPAAAADQALISREEEAGPVPAGEELLVGSDKKEETGAHRTHSKKSWSLIAFVICLFLLAVTGYFLQRARFPSQTALDTFWTQFAGSANNVYIVMPVIGSDALKEPEKQGHIKPTLSLEDTNVAARIAGLLEKRGTHYEIVSADEVSLGQLRTGPSVLIGALDNVWTMHLMQKLPFVFEESAEFRTGSIVDTNSGGSKRWTTNISGPYANISHDYGIIARYTNDMTGEPVVVAAGISSQGAAAAGELLTSSQFESIRSIAASARNFEIVLDTEAIDGKSGRPRILATKTW